MSALTGDAPDGSIEFGEERCFWETLYGGKVCRGGLGMCVRYINISG